MTWDKDVYTGQRVSVSRWTAKAWATPRYNVYFGDSGYECDAGVYYEPREVAIREVELALKELQLALDALKADT